MSDATLFATVVEQMHHGRSYYEAMGDVLRHGSAEPWPTASVFNWRPPLVYWLLSTLPMAPPVLALFTEVWAGLILLGAFLVPASWPRTRIAASTMAVLVRELAGLGCLVLLVRHWRERRTIGVASVVIVLYYAMHWTAVVHAQQPGDLAPESWIALGGVPFLVRTFDLSPLGLLWPTVGPWLWGLVLLAMLASSRVPRELRITVALYFVAFLIIGRSPGPQFDGNYYWGAVIVPTQVLAVVRWLRTLRAAGRQPLRGRAADVGTIATARRKEGASPP
jgi:hypothetical protein